MPSRHPAVRLIFAMAAALVLAACSPPSGPATPEDPTATPPNASATKEMTRLNDQRDAFLARCLKNAVPTENGTPANADTCAAAYYKAQQGLEAARILIATHARDGAASATSLEQLKTRLPQINWTNEQVGGSTLGSGRVAPFEAVITQRNNQKNLAFNWSGPAGEIPVNIAYALLMEGAQLKLFACKAGSGGETGQAWHVSGTDSEPFDLVTFSSVGPSGTAQSSYSASTPLGNTTMTLENLRATDSDWAVCD